MFGVFVAGTGVGGGGVGSSTGGSVLRGGSGGRMLGVFVGGTGVELGAGESGRCSDRSSERTATYTPPATSATASATAIAANQDLIVSSLSFLPAFSPASVAGYDAWPVVTGSARVGPQHIPQG
ncbi:MAG TPA: hypothetical protein VFJ14_08615 [Nocardioidaceae bacterium]|nr:hypothetical protein [Nocardioidaceae bacterium]